jgi:uncharacterized protein with beta-barrel porin domain
MITDKMKVSFIPSVLAVAVLALPIAGTAQPVGPSVGSNLLFGITNPGLTGTILGVINTPGIVIPNNPNGGSGASSGNATFGTTVGTTTTGTTTTTTTITGTTATTVTTTTGGAAPTVVTSRPGPLVVSLVNSLAQTSIRAAWIQDRQIDRHLTELREVAEIAEDQRNASAAGGTLSIARSGNPEGPSIFAAQMSPASEAAFTSDLEMLTSKRISFFASGFAGFGGHDGSAADSGYSYVQPGLTLGVDYQFSDSLRAGFSFGFNHYHSALSDGGDDGTNTYLFSVYGSFRPTSHSFIQLNVGYGSLQTATSRLTGSETATGSTSGNQINGSATAGYDFRIDALRLTPFVTLQGSATSTAAYTESLAGIAGINYGGQQAASLNLSGGLEASYQWQTKLGLFIATARGAYHHEFIDGLNSRLSSVGGVLFIVPAVATAMNYGLLGLDARMLMKDGSNVTVGFEHAVGRGRDSFSIGSVTYSRYF